MAEEKGAKAAKKPVKKKAAKKSQPEEPVREGLEEAAGEAQGAGAGTGSGSGAGALEEEAGGEQPREELREEEPEQELSEEDMRRLVEESLERVTVADIVLNIMNQLASIGYLKMGLPESANSKYRDLEQARLAIDVLDGMIKASEGKVPEDMLTPFRGTLANMKMNFVQQKARG
jgi:hypothetical protein